MILRSTSVTDKIPVYFKDEELSTLLYEYTSTVGRKLVNCAPALSNFNVCEYFSNPQTCQLKNPIFAMNHMAMLSLEI